MQYFEKRLYDMFYVVVYDVAWFHDEKKKRCDVVYDVEQKKDDMEWL